MQNVVNYIVPFFGNDGKPISAGRVFFCNKNTSARTSGEIQPPDLILVKDKDGSPLQNPLPLDDSGRFTTQPFVDYDVDFKMYVDEPTGLPPLMDDDSPCWNTVLVMSSFDNKFVKVEYSGMPVVGTLAELRMEVPVNTPAVLVLGYNDGDTFCPPRVFRFVHETMDDNGGDHIRPQNSDEGTWVCDLGDVVDVRVFGINPESSGDYSAAIEKLAQDFKSRTLYFPKGNYYISRNINFGSVIMEAGAYFRPNANVSSVVSFARLDNRGGRFCANAENRRVFPKVPGGVMRTSWFSGNLAAFVFDASGHYSGIFNGADAVVFDDENIDYGTAGATLQLASTCVVNRARRALPKYIEPKYALDLFTETLTVPGIDADGAVLKGNRLSFGRDLLLEYNAEEGYLYVPQVMKSEELHAVDLFPGTTHFDKASIAGASSYIGIDDDYTLCAEDSSHKRGNVVVILNESESQRYITMRAIDTGSGTTRKTKCTINASTALMFVCTGDGDSGVGHPPQMSRWSPMSNVTQTITED